MVENQDFSLVKYNEGTLLTWNRKGKSRLDRTKHAMLGIIDECGEISKIFKKMVGYDKEFDKTGLVEELGDFLYYLTRIADETDYTKDSAFVAEFDRVINWKQTPYDKELSATEYCVRLVRDVYLINSSINKFDLPENIIHCLKTLKRFCLYAGVNLQMVAEANLKKLEERHGKTYNPENLETRDPEREKAVINEKI